MCDAPKFENPNHQLSHGSDSRNLIGRGSLRDRCSLFSTTGVLSSKDRKVKVAR